VRCQRFCRALRNVRGSTNGSHGSM
jgi:hypothetical protein